MIDWEMEFGKQVDIFRDTFQAKNNDPSFTKLWEWVKINAKNISSPVEPEVSQENGEDESYDIFDKLLNGCTKAKLNSGLFYWLTSERRIFLLAKKYLSKVEMRKLHNKYDSRFSG